MHNDVKQIKTEVNKMGENMEKILALLRNIESSLENIAFSVNIKE